MPAIDIVDEFDEGTSVPKSKMPPPPPPPSKEASIAFSPTQTKQPDLSKLTQPTKDEDTMPEDLAKELAEGMEKLMRELAGSSSSPAPEDAEEARKRAEAWEKLLVDGMDGAGPSSDPNTRRKVGTEKSGSPEDAFQASILQAMEKLKNSDTALHVRRHLFTSYSLRISPIYLSPNAVGCSRLRFH